MQDASVVLDLERTLGRIAELTARAADAHFLVTVEADGSELEAQATLRELIEALNEDALLVIALEMRSEIDALVALARTRQLRSHCHPRRQSE